MVNSNDYIVVNYQEFEDVDEVLENLTPKDEKYVLVPFFLEWQDIFQIVEIKKSTEKAILIHHHLNGDERYIWLPKSQINITSNGIEISSWLAKKENITCLPRKEKIFDWDFMNRWLNGNS